MKSEIIATCAAIGALLGLFAWLLSPAPCAHADEAGYLKELEGLGITILNAPLAEQRGHEICAMLMVENGEMAAHDLFNSTSYTETPDLYTAEKMVLAAAVQLCPSAIHAPVHNNLTAGTVV